METDPMGGMFSQMFDRMQPMGPANTMPASEADTIRAEEESRRLNRQVAELRSENSTLSSGNQELQSTNRQLLSTNRTLRKQLSELNETTKLLGEIKKRERACAEKEERCNHILNRQAALESREANLQSDRTRFDSEREQLYKSIAEQVSQEVERERQRLGEDNDRRCEKAKRILFALCVGVCSFAVPMLVIVMAGRWHILAATLPEWLYARKQQLAAIGQWLGNVDAWLGEIIPQGWWNEPLAFLLMLLILVAVVHPIYLLKVASKISRFIEKG